MKHINKLKETVRKHSTSPGFLFFREHHDTMLGGQEIICLDQTKPNSMVGNKAPAWIWHGTGNSWLHFLIGSFKLIKTTSASLCWSWVAEENLDGNSAEGLQEMLLVLVTDSLFKTLQGKEAKQWPDCKIMKEFERTWLLRKRVGRVESNRFYSGF